MPLDIPRLRALRPENEIHYFATTSSTMSEATKLASQNAPHGTVVVADEQTAGIGRLGRSWLSEFDAGIYCSILLRLDVPAASLPIASLLLGLATAEAIQQSTHLACDLRWPNDVLIGERKVAGILTQLLGTCIVAGIGINVNQTKFPADLRTPATSLRIAAHDTPQSRENVLVHLLASVDTFCSMLAKSGPESILRAFSAVSSYTVNRRVSVEESGLKGTTAGLDPNGFLLVQLDSGRLERIATGGIRPAS
jgi:BirA family biotin operon repressor/biotin-[acetyl-CoA-carboxylase] ligase